MRAPEKNQEHSIGDQVAALNVGFVDRLRFYSLWDKVYRIDVLVIAYQRCRANRGSHGVDGQRFDDIKRIGPMEWLAQLREELKSRGYRPRLSTGNIQKQLGR